MLGATCILQTGGCVYSRAFPGMAVLRFWLICHVLGGTLRILRINMHYEVVWPSGDLLGIFPSYGAALQRARVYWGRGYACRIKKCVASVAPSALTLSAAVQKIRRGEG